MNRCVIKVKKSMNFLVGVEKNRGALRSVRNCSQCAQREFLPQYFYLGEILFFECRLVLRIMPVLIFLLHCHLLLPILKCTQISEDFPSFHFEFCDF